MSPWYFPEALTLPTMGAEATWTEQNPCEAFVLGLLTWWAPGCSGRITKAVHRMLDHHRDIGMTSRSSFQSDNLVQGIVSSGCVPTRFRE